MFTIDITGKTITNEDMENLIIIGNGATILNSKLTNCDLSKLKNSKLEGCVLIRCILEYPTIITVDI